MVKGKYLKTSVTKLLAYGKASILQRMPKSTIQYIVSRWKLYGNTDNCLRLGDHANYYREG